MFTQPLCLWYNFFWRIRHEVKFLSGVHIVRIQTFLSPKLVTLPKLKFVLLYYFQLGVGRKNRYMTFLKVFRSYNQRRIRSWPRTNLQPKWNKVSLVDQHVCFFLLFNGISTFLGCLMSNPSFSKNCSGTI